jgi:hypothetical protein
MKLPITFLSLAAALHAQDPISLLDAKLSNFEIFCGVPHKTLVVPAYPASTSEDGRTGTPIGLGQDPLGVFKVIEEAGKPVLHISGQMYAGLSTKGEYENYHFSCQYKWGTGKYEPRLQDVRDSGVLIHCTGKQGAFWNVWMSSLECQVQEGDTTDFIPLAGTNADVSVGPEFVNGRTRFIPGGPLFFGTGYTKHAPTVEKPHGEWNTLEIYTLGQTSVFVSNGTPSMVIFNTRHRVQGNPAEVPLTKGKIQIQSEAAEIFYRELQVTPISAFPESLVPWVQRPAGEAVAFTRPTPPDSAEKK